MRASDIVRTVPVYRLEVARDFGRLDDVIDQLVDWHSSRGTGDTARTASALTE